MVRISLFNRGKVQPNNDEDVGMGAMEVASHADESFPDEDEVKESGHGKKKGRAGGPSFFMRSFFKPSKNEESPEAGSGDKGQRKESVRSHRMLGINTLITDSFYQDKEDEADEWRSQMDLFADAYESESHSNRPSLTPASQDLKPVGLEERRKRRPSFMDVADKNQSYLIRSLFGEMPSQPNSNKVNSRKRSMPKRTVSWSVFSISMKDSMPFGNMIHPFGKFRQNWDLFCMALILYVALPTLLHTLLSTLFSLLWLQLSFFALRRYSTREMTKEAPK